MYSLALQGVQLSHVSMASYLATGLDELAEPLRESRANAARILQMATKRRDAALVDKEVVEADLQRLTGSPAMQWVFEAVPMVFSTWALPKLLPDHGDDADAILKTWDSFVELTKLDDLLLPERLEEVKSKSIDYVPLLVARAQSEALQTAQLLREVSEEDKASVIAVAGSAKPPLPESTRAALLARAQNELNTGTSATESESPWPGGRAAGRRRRGAISRP